MSAFMLFMRKLHKWLGLIVGLQLLLWTVSGLIFAWLDHHEVSAEHSVRTIEPKPISTLVPVAEPSAWAGAAGTHIYEITLTALLDQWVWRVDTSHGIQLRSLSDGAPFQLDQALVSRLALSRYQGSGDLRSVTYQATPGIETRDAGAVWKAEFDDARQTTLYFAAEDGRLVAARNASWRLFDFFWMLHTMDYEGRDNFNNPLVITFGTGALWLSLSGLLLLTRSFRRQDFDLIGAWRSRAALRVVNGQEGRETHMRVRSDQNLFLSLAAAGVQLPSNCGGGGSCGLCVVRFHSAPPTPAAEDQALLARTALDAGMRLACRHYPSGSEAIELPEALVRSGARTMEVASTRFLTPFIKEVTLKTHAGGELDFEAGSYVQIETTGSDLRAPEAPAQFASDWAPVRSSRAPHAHAGAVRRAYSMANAPSESRRELRFNVRLALPPADAPEAPFGLGSSYMFTRAVGDLVRVRGPFGTFRDSGSSREKVFIGGGAGMAPLRSILVQLLESSAPIPRISYWYGARSTKELFYCEDFERLSRLHPNFSFHIALSEPGAADRWKGLTGLIHSVVLQQYLVTHDDPAACEYYLCGPPLMLRACRSMLAELGVPETQVFFDDFGI